MNNKNRSTCVSSTTLAAVVSLGLSVCANSYARELQLGAEQPTAASSVGGTTEAGKPGYRSNIYLVQLENEPVATYAGGVAGLAATSNSVTGARRLDTNSEASVAYAYFLQKVQADFIKVCETAFGHSLNVPYKYQHAVNGIAVELSAEEADVLRGMSGVRNVQRERFEVLQTDVGPVWIGAPAIWSAPPGNRHSRGEGIVVAVLDTGINHDHPSFADIGGNGFDHNNPLGSGNYVPGSYCDVTDPSFCNDKLIGAWSFVPDDANYPVPEDSDGHGSHTASTAAGNVVPAATLFAPTTSLTRSITGVAPHANIIAYDVCIDSCPGSALVAAVNQVIIDNGTLPNGIAALNYSISGGNDPYNDTVELGFLAASAAGIYVSTSAGNDGPGSATTGHNSPWVSATAAMTHNRRIDNSVIGLGSDADPLADIPGAGFTSGYGPAPIINSADLEGTFPGSTLCGLGAIDDFNPPWPPGTFNGEIVACTRGTFGRVEKGANVLAAGAGGYILMDNGSGIVADAHVLPGVHISQADGATLAAWLAANSNPMGSISGFALNTDDANGDVMAGFSSRGPNSSIDILKPDVAAPGVSVMAAEATDGVTPTPEYQFLSGTSMASPHQMGAAALLSAVRPDWSPYAIKSALMMTSTRAAALKEDGSTPADPFDIGAGRIDLSRVQDAGLVLDETPTSFLAADPALGGDPGTLNIASMQDGACVGTCTWTRRVRNVAGRSARWSLSTTGPAGLDVYTRPRRNLRLAADEIGTIKVNANTALASPGWNFASVELERRGDGPDLHMPIAIFAANSSNTNLLGKTVDAATAAEDEPLNYQIDITNGALAGPINLDDEIPRGLNVVRGSLAQSITNGTTIAPFSRSGGSLTWRGTLDPGGIQLMQATSPFGYIPLSSLGVTPIGCPSDCDDGGFIFNVPTFTYNNQSYSQMILSVNGTIEAGSASLLAASASNQNLPDPTVPNNILAPFWTDLNLGAGGNWYIAVLSAGPQQFTVIEWEDVPLFGDPLTAYTFQIWIENGTAGNIWFVYARIDEVNSPSGVTVGVENENGGLGSSYFFEGTGTPPAVGTDLMVEPLVGGTATFNFQAIIDDCDEGDTIVNRVNVTTAGTADTAIAVTQCVDDDD